MSLTAREFIAKWQAGAPAFALNERAGAQAHFIDLCRVLGVPEPDDPERYCFERGVTRTGSERQRVDGFADVWLKGHFAWEYKAPGRNLEAALRQLMMYALPLESPPLLVVSDRQRIEIHTHFTGTPSERQVVQLEDIALPEVQQTLRALWTDPERFRPARSNRDITEQAARTFAATAERLRAAGVPGAEVSHFLTQCLFCFFAEDVGLLPQRLFERLVGVRVEPARLRAQLQALFETMRDGGLFGVDDIAWFNGGLFGTIAVPGLAVEDVKALQDASALVWSAIDPSIFGTLFERGLDPGKRSQLGAHYTDPATILRLVEPVVQRPLLAEWSEHKAAIAKALVKSKRHRDKAWREAQAEFARFLERLSAYRVLDPACGSGNFLYLALKALKDVEHQANFEAEALGLERQHDVTGPHNVLGIEVNEYAAELARVTVWIGELQWRIQRGYAFKLNPVLEPLDHIECRDALMTWDPVRAEPVEALWPKADAVVGNPPFVGDKKMRGELGDEYTERLRALYKGRVPGGADLVCYWFERARAQIAAGVLQRAGLVATQAIRTGTNRTVLDAVVSDSVIFEAWADEPWVNLGAAVRVSMIAFGRGGMEMFLDGEPVARISSELTANDYDLTRAASLAANAGVAFQGPVKVGAFDVPGSQARRWLAQPNPQGRPNADVLRPWANGKDLSGRTADKWIVDFGPSLEEDAAALFEGPFEHVRAAVRPQRLSQGDESRKRFWWKHGRTGSDVRGALSRLPRYIATVRVAKHRFFVWLASPTWPDSRLFVFARSDDTTVGLLSSRIHEGWSLANAAIHGDGEEGGRPTYNTGPCFETFPFPAGLTPADTAHQRTETLPDGALVPADLPPAVRPHAEAIARAAKRLVDLRDAWLNPPEWSERVPEVVPLGMDRSPYPDRVVARPGFEKPLAKRTLTNLYNERPAWLAQAHAALDAAVAAAYGWDEDESRSMSDDEVLRRLLALNLERAAAEAAPAAAKPKRPLRPLSDRIIVRPSAPEAPARGDVVMPAKYAGSEVLDGAGDLTILSEDDVLRVIEGPSSMESPVSPPSDGLLEDPRNVPLWFATNRAALPRGEQADDDPTSAFGNEWSETVTLGRLVVNVPAGHVPGSLGSGFWLRLVRGDDRLRALTLQTLPEADFWQGLGSAMAEEREPGEPRDALFFLHGYNNSFRDAALRTAQLAYDLRIRPAVFFSWPSGGGIDDYAADETHIELSHDPIAAFLQRLDACSAQSGTALHVVAHSMGNRGLLHALEVLSATLAQGAGRFAIDKIVFAAPDVDARQFTLSLKKLRALGGRKTLYVSRRDRALWLSRSLHKYARAGLLPPVTLFDGIDTIDATDVDTTFLGHSYIATVRALIADLKSLLETGRAPTGRTGLEPVSEAAGRYWRLR